MSLREFNFDGIVGPTHNYAGLSRGNVASTGHGGRVSNPRAAALQGIAKMRFVASLGVGQAVLPPQPRPDVDTLRRLGFTGDDAAVLDRASRGDGLLLRLCSSASAMWTANAATVAPSTDTLDGRAHLTAANLSSMFHRSLEAPFTIRVLRKIFDDAERFAVHEALPGGPHFADEGAANHLRLSSIDASLHVFAWGRSAWSDDGVPTRFPRRQTLEASQAVARKNALSEKSVLYVRQSPAGIDAGAFHTDVLAVGNGAFLLAHEEAFTDTRKLIGELAGKLGDTFRSCLATARELPLEDAVDAYPFNSQVLTLADGAMAIVAPAESERNEAARRFFERVLAEENPVIAVHYVDVNASMDNGGGPACLRLRVPLSEAERAAIGARVIFDEPLDRELCGWVGRHYRDRLTASDLKDPALLDESRRALDELTTILRLGSVYDFQT